MRIGEKFNSRFLIFLVLTLFVGAFPILLYPFSQYFRRQNEFSEGNHGPLHQFPAGDYNYAQPKGIDWLIDITFLWPTLIMFIISLIVFLYYLFSKKYKIGFSYLIPALLSFVLMICQFITLYWLFD
jgi:hypothetical protein